MCFGIIVLYNDKKKKKKKKKKKQEKIREEKAVVDSVAHILPPPGERFRDDADGRFNLMVGDMEADEIEFSDCSGDNMEFQ